MKTSCIQVQILNEQTIQNFPDLCKQIYFGSIRYASLGQLKLKKVAVPDLELESVESFHLRHLNKNFILKLHFISSSKRRR